MSKTKPTRRSGGAKPNRREEDHAPRRTKNPSPITVAGIDEKFVRDGAAAVTDADFEKVADSADEIRQKFSLGGPVGRLVDDGEVLLSMVRDYWSGEYRAIPYWAIAAAVFSLLYLLNPLDVIPDVIPFVGLLDDAAVLGACLAMVEKELLNYRQWKKKSLRPKA